MTAYNRVLLQHPPFMREFKEPKAFVRDASSFHFIIEEIVSVGAVGIAIPAGSLGALALDALQPAFRSRITLVDQDCEIARSDRAIREPINEEFGLQYLHPESTGAFTFTKQFPQHVLGAVSVLNHDWYDFLLGLEFGLQIDIDIERMRQAIATLRTVAHSTEARTALATLAGVLSTYQAYNVGVIQMVSVAQDDLVQVFEAFLQDETYRSMSGAFHDIGFGRRVKSKLSRIATLAKRLIRKKTFQNVVDLGTKSVTAATQIPIPDAELGERLLTKRYLPSAISLGGALERAHSAWRASGRDFVNLKGFGQQYGAGNAGSRPRA